MVIIAVVVAIFIIYDRDNDDTKIFSSFARCIRRLIALIADVTSDLISIFSSLTEILNLIRILVFGKIDSQTQIFLANYAVIFMSVVSYFTTMTGLTLVLGEWQAVLASFGIQVGILVFSARLSRLVVDQYGSDKKKRYVYRLKGNGFGCTCNNGQESCGKVFVKVKAGEPKGGEVENGNEEGVKTDEQKRGEVKNRINGTTGKKGKGKRSWKKGLAWIGTIVILILLMMCSSFFSYNAFWNKFVWPMVPLSEYADVQVSISEVEEEYSKSLKGYQKSLEDILYRVNNEILENLDVSSIRMLEVQLQSLNSRLDNVGRQIEEIQNRRDEFEEGSPEWNAIEDGELAYYRDNQETIEDNIEQTEGQLYPKIPSKLYTCLGYQPI